MPETTPAPDLLALSRKAWGDLESLHVLGYFAPEVKEAYTALGLHPDLAYFPGRSAAFGPCGPGLSISTFYVFAPWMAEAILPAAWDLTTPADVVAARRTGMSAVLRRVLGEPDVTEALAIARDVCAGMDRAGRPLYAAHADLAWPEDELLALWHAATLIREHRGDGHVAVLQQAGLDPVEATVLGGVWSGTMRFLQKTRGWSDEEYDAASARLRERGLLDAEGGFTEQGKAFRQQIEDDTDRLALAGWAAVGAERTARLHELVKPLREAVAASDVLPRSLRGSKA